ncbi:MAG TPA: DNA gyrase subunit A [Moraxellaceae bacterium]|nr:DNA gyrase subunit A [Moraxellaceae bacterium]
MTEFAKEILPVNIEDELRQSYLDYAMSVIVGRALPDVRDGLKPVHRRVLFAMHELGNDWNKAYKKSARVVGDVIGKYHPHGDSAVYDTIVRMAQPFSLRYMLVDGQGNFGSIDGDNAAAMRYTEVRMTKLAHELLADLDKETVDWVPNYDGTEQIPAVMPTKVPNLLVNGSAGIAVGMATNIPPHNLTEVINGCLAYLDDEAITIDGLMEHIKGPDFPTAAIINGRAGIIEAYRTGRGRIYMRARHEIETDAKTGRQAIIFTEIPYQLNKARVIEKIAELVKEKKLEGISELRDESDKDGMRIVIELKRGEVAEVVVNNLFAQTQLQSVFGINMVALVDGQPKLLNLKEMIEAFVRHRREVVTRRTVFELRKARERGHILEGLAVALANIDPVIDAIKTSPSPADAKERLMLATWEPGSVVAMLERAGDTNACRPEGLPVQFGLVDGKYRLSAEQAQAILDLRLNRLTGLEQDKLVAEYQEILERIRELGLILADPERLLQVIRDELHAVREQFGDARRTEIISSRLDLTLEDLITEEQVVLTISHAGYAKTQPLADYRAQRRGGRGKSATAIKDEDYIEHLLVASTHDTVLCFTSAGKVYWLKVYELPSGGRGSKGKPIVNILPLAEGERLTALLPIDLEALAAQAPDEDDDLEEGSAEAVVESVPEAEEGEGADDDADDTPDEPTGAYIFMATANGTVKKTPLVQFSRPRSNGLIALRLEEGDTLIAAAVTNGACEIMLFSDGGKVIRFKEKQVRIMGRSARGVRGMRLPEGQCLISMIVPESGTQILTASENGYGKRTPLPEFPRRGRGGQGVIAIQMSERNGALVAAVQVAEEDELMLISDQGTLVRTRVAEVSVRSRNTQGVTLIKLAEDEHLVGLVRLQDVGDSDEECALEGDDTTVPAADDAGNDVDAGALPDAGDDVSAGNE